jgi:hypothetical protein
MTATPETLALAALVILYFLLSAAELVLRARRSHQRRRQQQQVLQPSPTDQAAPLETPTAPDPDGEDEPAGEDGRDKQLQQRRRLQARRGALREDSGGDGGAAAAPAPAVLCRLCGRRAAAADQRAVRRPSTGERGSVSHHRTGQSVRACLPTIFVQMLCYYYYCLH